MNISKFYNSNISLGQLFVKEYKGEHMLTFFH